MYSKTCLWRKAREKLYSLSLTLYHLFSGIFLYPINSIEVKDTVSERQNALGPLKS